jgi:hypothetical protein
LPSPKKLNRKREKSRVHLFGRLLPPNKANFTKSGRKKENNLRRRFTQ